MNNEQPYYMIDFSAAACMFTLRVNDIPIVTMNVGGQAATRIPVNYAIFESGRQTVSATILPLQGTASIDKNAELTLQIEEYEVSNGFELIDNCCEYESPAIDSKKMLPIVRHNDSFKANVPYTLDVTQNSVNLKQVNNLREKVYACAHQLLGYVENENYPAFADAISEREAYMAESMYLSEAQSRGRTQRMINKFKNGYEPQPLPDNTNLVYCSRGRAVMLKDTIGEPSLRFVSEEKNRTLFVEAMFHIPTGETEAQII